MPKSAKKFVAVLLLLFFIGWIVITVLPSPKIKKENVGKSHVYEPKFKNEGTLYFIEEADTLSSVAIELANTPEEIQYGMMYRKHMDENTAMLFLMKEERPQSFWMKNTYVSLDIIYIDKNKEIVSIQKNAEPLSEKSLPSVAPALYVLEVKGGYCDKFGIKAKQQIEFSLN